MRIIAIKSVQCHMLRMGRASMRFSSSITKPTKCIPCVRRGLTIARWTSSARFLDARLEIANQLRHLRDGRSFGLLAFVALFVFLLVLKPVGKSAGVDDLAVFFRFDPEDAVADGDGLGQFIGLLGVGLAPGAIGLLGLGVDQVEDELAMAGA